MLVLTYIHASFAECAELSFLSVKGDIYSYGIVLLCLLTHKQPTNEFFFTIGLDMPTWVRGLFPQRYLEVMNPTLCNEVEAQKHQTKVIQFMEVALVYYTESITTPDSKTGSAEIVTNKRLYECL